MSIASITRKIDVRDPNVLPAWVPMPGTFADISTNTLYSARPSGWPTSGDVAGPFANWSGGVYCPEFGVSGGYAVFGSGHLSQNAALWAGVWVFDLETLSWVGRNVPSQPLLENVLHYDSYGQSNIAETLGHPYPPHTYDGLVYQSPANGGGQNGTLVQVSAAGSTWGTRVLAFDLSSATAPPSRVLNSLPAVSDTYPATCLDTTRNGFWATSGNMQGALSFVSFADWSVTAYPGVASNVYGNTVIEHIPTRDCLVAMSSGFGGVGMVMRVCPIVGGVPQGWTLVTHNAPAVLGPGAGFVWSTLMESLVAYSGTSRNDETLASGLIVYRVTPPANLTGGAWSWTSETLTGAGGAVPTYWRDTNGNIGNNGTWSRFVEVPEFRCFLYAGSSYGPTQAWRLTGM